MLSCGYFVGPQYFLMGILWLQNSSNGFFVGPIFFLVGFSPGFSGLRTLPSLSLKCHAYHMMLCCWHSLVTGKKDKQNADY